jgi:hypothetical protein
MSHPPLQSDEIPRDLMIGYKGATGLRTPATPPFSRLVLRLLAVVDDRGLVIKMANFSPVPVCTRHTE